MKMFIIVITSSAKRKIKYKGTWKISSVQDNQASGCIDDCPKT